MGENISKAVEVEICKAYVSGASQDTLTKTHRIGKLKLLTILRTNGVQIKPHRKSRKYFFDESVFEKIDEEWKAYFLGWMYADGNINKNLREASIQISEKDKIVLENFNRLIFNGKKPLQYRKSFVCNAERGYVSKPSYRLRICSVKVCKDLCKLGLHPHKSLSLTWPNNSTVPENLMPHFLRGEFEGDGCIWNKKGRRHGWSIIGSYEFMLGLKSYLEQKLQINLRLNKSGKVCLVICNVTKDINKIMDYMYKDATLYLPRKRKNLRKLNGDRAVSLCDWEYNTGDKQSWRKEN